MTKTLTAIAAAATLTLATVAMPQHAEARHGRIAAGIVGGLAVGALVGAAAAHGPYYGYGPTYYYGPRCYWTRQRVWDGWGWRRARVRVCD